MSVEENAWIIDTQSIPDEQNYYSWPPDHSLCHWFYLTFMELKSLLCVEQSPYSTHNLRRIFAYAYNKAYIRRINCVECLFLSINYAAGLPLNGMLKR